MPAAIIGAGALAAGGAIGGAAIGAKASKKAAAQAAAVQQQTARESNALARENRDMLVAKIDPFYQSGVAATGNLNALLGLGGNTAAANGAFRQFIDSSDYAFNEGQGERGLGAKLSAGGGIESGAAIKATQQFRTNLQNGYRGQYMGLLGNQQGAGLAATNALAGVNTNFTNSVMANNQNAADAASNSALIRGNANAQFGATVGNALGNFAGSLIPGLGGFGSSFGGGSAGMAAMAPMRPTQYGGWI